MRVLVLGSSGMLGSAVVQVMSDGGLDAWGTLRAERDKAFFGAEVRGKLLSGIDVLDTDKIVGIFNKIKPDVVVNCVGVIKQLAGAKDPRLVLPLNSIFPHRLADLCGLSGARLVHISTDCVFSGSKGMYLDNDPSDAEDLYGKSKYIGELGEYAHAVTLRTSIIGHEIGSNLSLIDWFLAQKDQVSGYRKAVFSGFPTVELARIIRDVVIPHSGLQGVYNVSAEPINKYDLLGLVASQYGKVISIIPDDRLVIDRSLNSDKFKQVTGYVPPAWDVLVARMHQYYLQRIGGASHV